MSTLTATANDRNEYILEHADEARRLERQAGQHGYDLERELAALDFAPGARVLDAGCGTGLAARRIARLHPRAEVTACDLSELRLRQARDLGSADARARAIRFVHCPLERIDAPDAAFDSVFCRYVFEYLPDPALAAAEFLRVLAPGGRAYVVDFDGIFFNLHSRDRVLAGMLDRVREHLAADLFVGRKIPGALESAGFVDIDWTVEAIAFRGDQLAEEAANTMQRLAFTLPLVSRILDSEERAREMGERYLRALREPGSTLFYNKFLVRGRRG